MPVVRSPQPEAYACAYSSSMSAIQAGTLADASLAAHGRLRQDLRRWLSDARRAGLDDESIEALFMTTFRTTAQEDIA